MKKEIPCLDCRGQGFISKFNEKSAWLERCPNCGGTGVITVVVTNADQIRAMSDEKLADWIAKFVAGIFVSLFREPRCGVSNLIDDLKTSYLAMLQQPAGEDT